MNIKSIINEEVLKFKEGIADRYAEKEFNIPDPNAEMDKRATAAMVDPSNGIPVGRIHDRKKKVDTTVFLNPQSLLHFDEDVRALSDYNGNLFVAQNDQDFFHAEVGEAINANKRYNNPIFDYVYEEENFNRIIQWHRIGKTNYFGFSISYVSFANNQANQEAIQKLVAAVQRKNPNFGFVPQYWVNVRRNKLV